MIVDGAVSVVSYVPRDETDYGTLLCWGRNELGRQRRPCVFHVIPAGERLRPLLLPLFFLYYFRARTPVKMCSTLMRYIGAIKACESEFLQMVIALLWAGLGWSRSRGEEREIVVLSELLLQTLSGELLRPSPSTSYLLLLLLLHSVLLILNSISLSRIRLKVVCCPRSAKVGENGQAVAAGTPGGRARRAWSPHYPS